MHAQVEKAPVSIKANVPKAEAENLKKQIEAGTYLCILYPIVDILYSIRGLTIFPFAAGAKVDLE